ncbi:MAG: hypothetical protein V1794_17380 [Candidatus Glassbacteria bacterium]
MTNLTETGPIPGTNYKKTGLVIFGILQIILGAISVLVVPLMILGAIVGKSHGGSGMESIGIGQMIPGAALYLIMGVWLVWMGIGSIMARRWARTLILVASWVWLISGINGLFFMLLIMPGMYDQMGLSGKMPQEMISVAKYGMAGFMAFIGVIIPGVLVLFYARKSVKATCENRDTRLRWTDKCPLPVLGLIIIFAGAAFSMLGTSFTGWVMPFFGVILSGVKGALVALVGLAVLAYLAWGSYKLKIKAWWLALIFFIAGTLSAAITFSRVSLMDFFEKMKFPAQQLEMARQIFAQHENTIFIYSVLWFIAVLGYLLYTKRYFSPKPEQFTLPTPAGSP